jgi:hypothetical protein
MMRITLPPLASNCMQVFTTFLLQYSFTLDLIFGFDYQSRELSLPSSILHWKLIVFFENELHHSPTFAE